MGSIHEVIEAMRQAPSKFEKGQRFEKLMLRYFELDPMLVQQYDAVWLWNDWPGRHGRRDLGIDLVARERDTGKLTAVQCKFYDPSTAMSKPEVDGRFQETSQHLGIRRLRWELCGRADVARCWWRSRSGSLG